MLIVAELEGELVLSGSKLHVDLGRARSDAHSF